MRLALLRLWRRSVRSIGLAGQPGLLLLVAGVILAAAMPRLDHVLRSDYEALEMRARPLRVRAVTATREAVRTDRLAGYVEAFPTTKQIPEDLAEIFASADRHHVSLSKGDYQFKVGRDTPFAAYTATFPVRTEYASAKAFASDVMQGLPHASLDELRLSRDAADTELLDGVVRFTLNYRKP